MNSNAVISQVVQFYPGFCPKSGTLMAVYDPHDTSSSANERSNSVT